MKQVIIFLVCCLFGVGLRAETVPLIMTPNQNKAHKILSETDPNCSFEVGWTSWKPYQYMSRDKKLVGFQIELLHLIEEQMGCHFIFHQKIWSEAVESIKKGNLDFIGNASINTRRSAYAIFSAPYRQDLVVLYVRTNDKEAFNNTSLLRLFQDHKFRLGMVKGAVYDGQLTALQNNANYAEQFVYVKKSELLLDHLVNGKIDGYFEDPLIFDHSLGGHQINDFISVYPVAIKMGTIHFMFSKAKVTQQTVDRFNHALATIRKKYPEKFEWFEQ